MMTKYRAIIHDQEVWRQKFDVLCSFFMFGCCLFVCKLVCLMVILQCNDRNALVLVMERVPCCILMVFMGNVNHVS